MSSSIIRTCQITGKTFEITEWEQSHLKTMEIPLPTLCIEERHRRRLSHRNERTIYKRVCDLTKKSIVSLYPENSPFTVYSQEAWWGDTWDGRDFCQIFDFNRPFFEQFAELQKKVPRIALLNTKGENSEYCNVTTSNKNCYLVFGGDFNEDSMYCGFNFRCNDVYDCYWVLDSELLYECLDCYNCYNVAYSQNTSNCRDSLFLFECKNCENCIGCVGLRNKKYHVLNEPYSKEEFEKKKNELQLDSWEKTQIFMAQFEKFKRKFPHRGSYLVNCENCIGDRLKDCKNCHNVFDSDNSEDIKDAMIVLKIKDALSCDHVGHQAELYYEMLGSIEGYNCAFCSFAWTCNNVFYCDFVHNSKNIFGCVGLKRAEYCILNKQYSKEKYEKLKARIMEHMQKTGEYGEYFPIKYSPFAYNETMAQEYFPLTKTEALQRGFQWKEPDKKEYQPSNDKIPDSINDVKDEITNAILSCESCGKNYKIIHTELQYYRERKLPVPHFCPECRHKKRLAKRNKFQLWEKICDKCHKKTFSSYPPDEKQIIYCEECYLKTVM